MNDKESMMSKWKGFYWIEKLQGVTHFHRVRLIQLPQPCSAKDCFREGPNQSHCVKDII